MQQYYPFYTRDSLKDAVEIGDEPWTSWIPGRRAKGLIKFKEEQVYERIQATEEKAKVVLKDLVVEQFNHMSEKFLKNLKANNLEPTYNRLDYYFLNNFVQGGESLDLDKEIIEEVE